MKPRKQFFAAVSLIMILCCLLLSSVAFSESAGIKLSEEEKAWLTNHKVFKIGITPDWPPFEFLDDRGNYRGYCADLLRLMLEPHDIKISVDSSGDPWNLVLEKLKNGKIDSAVSMFISSSRMEHFNFSRPYVEVPHVIFVREGGRNFSGMSDLNGLKLAYMRGWVCQEMIGKDYPEINLVLSDKIEGMIGHVLLGNADAGLIDLASLSYYSKRHNLSALKVVMKAPYSPRLAFGFPKDDRIAPELFNRLLAEIPADRHAQIRAKWLATGDLDSWQYRHFMQVVLIIALISLGVFIWNVQLRRKIRERTEALEIKIQQNLMQSEALQESESKIRAFFDQTLQFLGLVTTEGEVIDVNRSALQFAGITLEDVAGKKFWDTPWFNHSVEVQQQLMEAIKKASSGNLVRYETTHRDFHGRMCIIDFSMKALRDASGAIKCLIAEGRDITSMHDLLRSQQESEERFRLVFENSPDAAWLLNKSGFLECNLAAVKIFGFEAKRSFMACHPSEFSPEFQPDGSRSIDAANLRIEQAFSEGVVRFEWEHRKRDGSLLPMEITLSRITLKDASVLFCVGRDLSERRKAEEARKLLEAQFLQAQKMDSVGRLAGGIAHDFNNLLTVMRGFAELIQMKFSLPEKAGEMLHEIVKAISSASNLTRQLLAFSRKQIIEPRQVNINDLIKNLQKMLPRILGEDITLNINLAPELGSCFTDPGQIEQVMVNLSANARDAMPRGGVLTIETARINADDFQTTYALALPPGAYTMISVRDNGCGMTDEVKKHLFEPFFTTKTIGKGTGLGLATVYGIVK
ncbi:MAG: transporter substrate-binding domain-containing protein, partial [Candidatus Riflebacteria bacterium]|nr:transporter substrate-binding domain-containing protein [Candidatus Riflebacteria bacterium]